MKNTKQILGLITILLFSYSLVSLKKAQNCDDNIIATWISEDDPSSKMIFNTNFKCFRYYNNVLVGTFTYKISDTTPQCGETVEIGECITYLNLTSDGTDKFSICYEINGITDKILSITPLKQNDPQIYTKE